MALKLLNFAGTQRVADSFLDAALDDALDESESRKSLTANKKNLVRLHVYLKSMTIEVKSKTNPNLAFRFGIFMDEKH